MLCDFVVCYRANFRQAIAVWVPYVAVMAAVVVNLLLLPGTFDAGNPSQSAARMGLLGLGLLVAMAGMTAMLLLSQFTFRVRDLYRLSSTAWARRIVCPWATRGSCSARRSC